MVSFKFELINIPGVYVKEQYGYWFVTGIDHEYAQKEDTQECS